VIAPGSSIKYDAIVTTTSGSSGGSYSGTLTITYNDQQGNTYSESVPVTFLVAVPIRQVSETSLSADVAVGIPSRVAFQISNTGNVEIYSPVVTLTVPSGLSVTANSTYARTGLGLAPGQRLVYYANVTSGPKTSEGSYTGTLLVSYTDQYGNQYSQTFSPGLVVVGSIELVVQSLTAAQASATTMTVSGTLLNEGQGSAFYLQVTGSVQRGQTGSGYVGEVDPNTPVPFSITIPSSASASSGSQRNLTLVATYQNDYGQSLEYKHVFQVELGASSLGSSLGSGTASGSGANTLVEDLLRYAVAVVIVVAIAASALYIRRNRRKRGTSRKESSNVI
jgi:hypothetical protein